LHYSEV